MTDPRLGWSGEQERAWRELGAPGRPGRVARVDRGWSTVLLDADDRGDGAVQRVRNLGADVAVGDWIVASDDGERVEHVLARRSAFVRRASFEGARAQAHTLAANVDVVALVHALTSPPNQRRLERELVLAFDSGAVPIVVLTKSDLVAADDVDRAVHALSEVAMGVDVLTASGITGAGVDAVRAQVRGGRTLAMLGASGVGKSTMVNALVGGDTQATGAVRDTDQRGRHTTTAAELVALPGEGWLIDTPGLRAVSLWLSGDGIERAFADVFTLMDQCRFRDCKHENEPGCAVKAAAEAGSLDPRRLESLKRLVAEEAALEAEQEAQLRAADRRGARRPPRR